MKINLAPLRKINKAWVVLGVALAIGIVAALATRSYLNTQVEAIAARGKHQTMEIVVAKTEIDKGSILSSQNLALRRIPVEYAHSGAVKPEDFRRIDGSVIAFAVKSGEMIMWSQMEGKRAPTFSARLLTGQRAITVVVDEINSISGMLEPGDLIDLMFTIDQSGRKMIVPLLQSVQVMATGQRSVDDPKSGERMQFATVTLNTTPDQAKSIIVARETGKLTALLRNPADKEIMGGKSFDLAALFGAKHDLQYPTSDRAIPVLYGGSAGKFPADALKLGRYRPPTTLIARQPPVVAATPAASQPGLAPPL